MSYTSMKSWLTDELHQIDESGLFKGEKIITTPQGSLVDTRDGVNINFCANNYLGLADHPDIFDAVVKGMRSHGFGMASVRFICGTQDIHKTLEERISEFLGTEDTILYTSCFDANTGLFEDPSGSRGRHHKRRAEPRKHYRRNPAVSRPAQDIPARGHGRSGGEAEGGPGRPLPAHRDRRRLQHAGRPRAAEGDMRPGGQVRRAGNG